MLVKQISRKRRRRGVILLVVISLLTLFAVVGLSFVLYSEGSANSARIWREARQNRAVEPEIPPLSYPDINKVVGELVYGVDSQGSPDKVTSAWYGHDVASAMYGWKEAASAAFPQGQPAGTNINTIAYGGVGLIRGAVTDPPASYTVTFNTLPQHTLVRYAGNNQQRRPEFYGTAGNQVYIGKNADYTYPDEKDLYLAAMEASTGKILVPSFHRPWLFNWDNATPEGQIHQAPDTMFVANGNVNPYKFRTLRPHPADHPQFPLPIRNQRPFGTPASQPDTFGDVENLPNKNLFLDMAGTQRIKQFDSFWMDIGFPSKQAAGKTYKPLVAILMLDLDGRINLNVAGNVVYPDNGNGTPPVQPARHYSNQGWGPWEINLEKVFANPVLDPNGALSSKLFRSGTSSPFFARYGNEFIAASGPNPAVASGLPIKPYEPSGPGVPVGKIKSGATGTPSWGIIDLDGSPNQFPGPGLSIVGPDGTGHQLYQSLPTFGPQFGGGSIALQSSTTITERTSHPAFFNPYYFNSLPVTFGQNKTFRLDDFRYLNLKYDFDPGIANSDLFKVYPNLLAQPSNIAAAVNRNPKPRWLTTPISNDLDRIGYTPWVFNAHTSYAPNPPIAANQPLTQPVALGSQQFPDYRTKPDPTQGPTPSPEFTKDWQSLVGTYQVPGFANIRSGISGLDLNRPLADYRRDPFLPFEAILTGDNLPNVTADPAATPLGRVNIAIQDRQIFAEDIFDRLVMATFGLRLNYPMGTASGRAQVGTLTLPAQGQPEYYSLQWLAQLAANIVDFIDVDDYITRFTWNAVDTTGGIVYGTEMPRLVVNEVYSRYRDNPDPNNLVPKNPLLPNGEKKATLDAVQQIFVELMNPLTMTSNANVQDPAHIGYASLLYDAKSAGKAPGYRLVVTNGPNPNLRDSQNFDGHRDTTAYPWPNTDPMKPNVIIEPLADPAGAEVAVAPLDPANATGTGAPATPAVGFYVVGPEDLAGDDGAGTPVPDTQMSRTIPGMKFFVPLGQPPKEVNVILQRLLIPHLPHNDPADPKPENGAYNPACR